MLLFQCVVVGAIMFLILKIIVFIVSSPLKIKREIREVLVKKKENEIIVVEPRKEKLKRRSTDTPKLKHLGSSTPSSSTRCIVKGKELPHLVWAQSPKSREVFMSGYLYKRRRNGNKRWKRLKNVIKAMSPRRFSLSRKRSSSSSTLKSGNVTNAVSNESWQRRFFELPSGNFLRYYRTHTRARRSKRKGVTRPDGAIDLSHITSLQMSREPCGHKDIVCVIHLYFQDASVDENVRPRRNSTFTKNSSGKMVYSLGIDKADEADASHWFSVLHDRIQSCRKVEDKDKDDDDDEYDDGAINMTSLPLLKHCEKSSDSFELQDHKSSRGDQIQNDVVEPIDGMFSFATVTVKHNLNEKEQDALRELITIVNSDIETVSLKNGVTVHLNKSTIRSILSCNENPYDTIEFVCQRYLRGRNFVPNKALAAMLQSIRWSLDNDITKLRDPRTRLEDILECDPELVTSRHPVAITGSDFQGRGVVFKYMGSACSIKEMSRKTSLDSLLKYHVYNTERSIMNLASLSKQHGRCIEQHRIVIDAAGWNLGLFNKASVKFLYHIAKIDQNNYIERLHTLTIINAPKTVAFCWKVVKTWLDQRTNEKVNIMSSTEEWKPFLNSCMPNSSIPTCYGGSSSLPNALAFSRAVNKIGGH